MDTLRVQWAEDAARDMGQRGLQVPAKGEERPTLLTEDVSEEQWCASLERISSKERLFNVNKLTWFPRFTSLSFIRSHRPVAMLFTVQLSERWGGLSASQSYAESMILSSNFSQWETGKHCNCFHKKKKKIILFVAHGSLTVVFSKSTHNHEVAAMYLPWTTVLCWLLAQLFENKELRTVHYVIHC